MSRRKCRTWNSYLRTQGIVHERSAHEAFSLLEKMRAEDLLWPSVNQRDDRSFGVILARAMEGHPLRFIVPVCPDYQRSAPLGASIGTMAQSAMEVVRKVYALCHERVAMTAHILVADTETDMPEIVSLLAGTEGAFINRCLATRDQIRDEMATSCGAQVSAELFTDVCGGGRAGWQTVFERMKVEVQAATLRDHLLSRFLKGVGLARRSKYQEHFRRSVSDALVQEMVIRHYTQYTALGWWMRSGGGEVLINNRSPNLRAIRRPYYNNRSSSFGLPIPILLSP